MADLNRRSFLRSAGGLGLGACMLPATEGLALSASKGVPHFDAIVIGGGISGLQTAYSLLRAGRRRVLVLEARDRVGGRTLNEAAPQGGYVELGGQWVGPTQDAVLTLMNHLGIGRFDSHLTGRDIDDTSGSFGAADLLDYAQAVTRIDSLSKQVPLDAPWNAAKAQKWDRMTLRDWMNGNMLTQGGKELIDLSVATSMGDTSEKLSFLWFLFYVHSGTNFETMTNRAQKWRIEGGSQSISLALQQRLGPRVITGAQVDEVQWNQTGVRLRVNGDQFVTAEKLVIAMMPKDVERMNFTPALPADRATLNSIWTGSPGDKYFCVYPTPFWRNAGLSGTATSDREFIALSFDNTPSSGAPGVLGGFSAFEGPFRPPTLAARRQATIDSFVKFFGSQAAQPLSYHEYSWGEDPLTAGCVSPIQPGLLTSVGSSLRQPVGPIHWAGTETSEVWNGYMDGAVRAGVRAAAEVDALLP